MQSLTPFHTFALPAHAQQIIKITSIEQLKSVWMECKRQNQPTLLLGQGSNVLFLQDFNGTVLINQMKGIQYSEDNNYHYLHVNGGEIWHDLIDWSLSRGINGLENLALIPGCTGSAPVQNIGAYGMEFKEVCDYVDVLNLTTAEQFRLTNQQCEFGYRDSVFKHQYRKEHVIVAVGLKLAKIWKPILKYGVLANLDERTVTAKQIFHAISTLRRSKLPDPNVLGNAGSFFKNPVVSQKDFIHLQQEYTHIPNFPQADGSIKLAAGWLIEQCGLKGYQIGGAAVHQEQALVLVNKDNATASDLVELAHHVRRCVALRFDVWLQPEVRFIGRDGELNAEQVIS